MGMQWALSIGLICIFQITGDVKQLSMLLLAILYKQMFMDDLSIFLNDKIIKTDLNKCWNPREMRLDNRYNVDR
jgi:hypothetical protein